MSKDLNQCNFIGRLGKDVEIKFTSSGNAIANFSIACGDDYKDKQGNKVEKTNWINVVIFGKLAEICGEYLSKGSQVFISGKQVTRKWTDQNGHDRYSTEIVANDMKMLGSKGGNSGGGQEQHPESQPKPQPAQQRRPDTRNGDRPSPQNFDDFDDD